MLATPLEWVEITSVSRLDVHPLLHANAYNKAFYPYARALADNTDSKHHCGVTPAWDGGRHVAMDVFFAGSIAQLAIEANDRFFRHEHRHDHDDERHDA